jgi:hypothetical protein
MATNPNKAFFTGTDQVMNWYDTNAKKPYWSVTDAKNKILFQYSGTDETESRMLLDDNIRAAERAGVNSILCLRIHPKVPKDGYFVSSSPEMVVTYFRPTEYDSATYYPAHSVGYMPGANNLESKLNALESKIAALTMQLETEALADDHEEDEPDDNFLSGLMKNPNIQAMLMQSIQSLLMPKNVTVKHMAGVDQHPAEEIAEDEKLATALEILSRHDDQLSDDLMTLAQMAETNPGQFQFLIKMLRK